MSIEVTQEDVDRANSYLTSAFRCTATLAEQFARHRQDAGTQEYLNGYDQGFFNATAQHLGYGDCEIPRAEMNKAELLLIHERSVLIQLNDDGVPVAYAPSQFTAMIGDKA